MTALALTLLASSSVSYAQEAGADSAGGNVEVREIVRGFFLKSNIGSTMYLGATAERILSGVMAVQIGVGQDFIDNERLSAAWEIDFAQGLFNGPSLDQLPTLSASLVEGDIHTFSGLASLEVSTYVTRRLGIGVRGGGGVMFAPLLMGAEEYDNEVVPNNLNGVRAKMHESPLPVVFGGPTVEYYTKLSHFSVGLEADVSYVIGFDLGITPTGFLKYTF